jgi:aminoglycoside 6'-N-acetyltransferase I
MMYGMTPSEPSLERVTIRDASLADAGAIASLLTELGYPVGAADAARRLERGHERVVVAVREGEVVGLLSIWMALPLTRSLPVARITALVVSPAARRHGAGRALMSRAAELAGEAGCEGIELTSGERPERAAAHRFYESLGYRVTSRRYWLPLRPDAGH